MAVTPEERPAAVRYDFAPLDGITKAVFRRVWSRYFGGADRLFIPFFSPTASRTACPSTIPVSSTV